MLTYLFLFTLLGVTWSHSNSSIPKIFYIQTSEVYNNPLLMETKAFCAFKQFLRPTYMSEQELAELSPLASSLVTQMPPTGIIFGYSNRRNDSSKNVHHFEASIDDDLLLRNYRGYAVSKRNWEYSSLPVWQGFVNNREMQVPKIRVIADNDTFSLYASSQAAGKMRDPINSIEEAQILLKRTGKRDQFSVGLFTTGKMNSEFFTEEILRHIEALHPSADPWEALKMSRFEVIGCMEKPSGRFISMVLAIKADIP